MPLVEGSILLLLYKLTVDKANNRSIADYSKLNTNVIMREVIRPSACVYL